MQTIQPKRPPAPKRGGELSIILWNPRPVPPPRVDPDFRRMPELTRTAESIRYNLACLEHWVSPGGELREACKISVGFTLLFLLLLLPCAVLAAVLHQLELAVKSLFNILLYAGGIAAILVVGVNLAKRWAESGREDRDADFDRFRGR
jgi:hypothetical protein